MPYSFEEALPEERDENLFEMIDGKPVEKTPYKILDEDRDWIGTVYSKTEAEALVSHLNRYG